MLSSTNPTDADRKEYDKILEKFDAFFKVRKNTIFERARFNKRNQLEGESAESYITALYELAENCDYGAPDARERGTMEACVGRRLAANNIEVTQSLASLDIDPDTAFLDNLTPSSIQAVQWSATIQVNGKPMTFKLDTGAEVTAISSTAHQLLGKVQLITSDKILYGPSRQSLQVVGRFTATVHNTTCMW